MKFRYTGIAVTSFGGGEKWGNYKPKVFTKITPQIKAWIVGKAKGKGNSRYNTVQNSDCSKKCKGYWIHFRGNCYKKFPTKTRGKKLTYYNARNYCKKQKKGNLASAPDASTRKFILSLLNNKERKGKKIFFWLGGTDRGKRNEGKWKWEDGTKWKKTNWAKGQPNDKIRRGAPQDFLEMRGRDGRWADNNKKKRRGFICQYPL